jgi:hypothetical protein
MTDVQSDVCDLAAAGCPVQAELVQDWVIRGTADQGWLREGCRAPDRPALNGLSVDAKLNHPRSTAASVNAARPFCPKSESAQVAPGSGGRRSRSRVRVRETRPRFSGCAQIGGRSGLSIRVLWPVLSSSRCAVIAAEQPAEPLMLDDIPGGGVVVRIGRDQFVSKTLMRPLPMKEAVDRLPPITRS